MSKRVVNPDNPPIDPNEILKDAKKVRNQVLNTIDSLNAKTFEKGIGNYENMMNSMMFTQVEMLRQFYDASNDMEKKKVKMMILDHQDVMHKSFKSFQKNYSLYGNHISKESSNVFKKLQDELGNEMEGLTEDIGVRIGSITKDLDFLTETFSTRVKKMTEGVRDWAQAWGIANLAKTEEADDFVKTLREGKALFGRGITWNKLNNMTYRYGKESHQIYSREEVADITLDVMKEFSTSEKKFLDSYVSTLAKANKLFGMSPDALSDIVWADSSFLDGGGNGNFLKEYADVAKAFGENEKLNISGNDILSAINTNIEALYGIGEGDSKKVKRMTDSLIAIEAYEKSNVGAETLTTILKKFNSLSFTELINDPQAITLMNRLGMSGREMYDLVQTGPSGMADLGKRIVDMAGKMSEQDKYFMVTEQGIGESVGDLMALSKLDSAAWEDILEQLEKNNEGGLDMGVKDGNTVIDFIKNLFSQNNLIQKGIEQFFEGFDVNKANLANAAIIASSGVELGNKLFNSPLGKRIRDSFVGERVGGIAEKIGDFFRYKVGEGKVGAFFDVLFGPGKSDGSVGKEVSESALDFLRDQMSGVEEESSSKISDVIVDTAKRAFSGDSGQDDLSKTLVDGAKNLVDNAVDSGTEAITENLLDGAKDTVKDGFFKKLLGVFKKDAEKSVSGGFFRNLLTKIFKDGAGSLGDAAVGTAVDVAVETGADVLKKKAIGEVVDTGGDVVKVGLLSKLLDKAKGLFGKGAGAGGASVASNLGMKIPTLAGIAMAVSDGIRGYSSAEEWGNGKFESAVGGALGGTGTGILDKDRPLGDKIGSLLWGGGKGALIGSFFGGPVGAAVGGVIGAVLAGIGGKNIADGLSYGDTEEEAREIMLKHQEDTDKYLYGIPGYAGGLSEVPRDGIVKVHEGESILTKIQSEVLRGVSSDGGIPISEGGSYGREIVIVLLSIRDLLDTYFVEFLKKFENMSSYLKDFSLGGDSAGGVRGVFGSLKNSLSGLFGGLFGGSGGSGGSTLGSISAKYEVGTNGNSGYVSSGRGDAGGVSYGIPQFSSKTGSASEFANWLNSRVGSGSTNQLANSTPGTEEFSSLWKKIASELGEDQFKNLQIGYLAETSYNPFVSKVKSQTGVDSNLTRGLQEMAWSTATQFGANGQYVYTTAKVNSSMSPSEIIQKVMDNKQENVDEWFGPKYDKETGRMIKVGSSVDVRKSVYNRFLQEEKDLMAIANDPPVGIPAYANGTPWVPDDQLAVVHKGEMIVPSHANPLNTSASPVYSVGGSSKGADNSDVVDTLKWMVHRLEAKLDKVIQVSSKVEVKKSRSYEQTDTDRVFSY